MIILTGAAGFIGSHVAEKLERDHRMLLVDKPEHFRERPYLHLDEADLGDWMHGNDSKPSKFKIVDRAYFPKILDVMAPAAPVGNPKAKEHVLLPPGEKIEWMIHLGACTNTGETRKDFLDEWNVEYSKKIWSWCTQHKVPLIYASSGATYGNGEFGFSDSWETAFKLKPMNPYGQSKQDFDMWAHEQITKGKTPPNWYGLKFFNVYGSQEGHKGRMASAVLHSFRQIQRTGACKLFKSHNESVKDGEQSRDFIHVNDIVNLITFFMQKKPASALYNCGTGKARTFRDLVEAIFLALDKPVQIEWTETPPQFRKAYQYFTEADMSKAREVGYKGSFISLEDGVRQYVEWLKENDPTEVVVPRNFQ